MKSVDSSRPDPQVAASNPQELLGRPLLMAARGWAETSRAGPGERGWALPSRAAVTRIQVEARIQVDMTHRAVARTGARHGEEARHRSDPRLASRAPRPRFHRIRPAEAGAEKGGVGAGTTFRRRPSTNQAPVPCRSRPCALPPADCPSPGRLQERSTYSGGGTSVRVRSGRHEPSEKLLRSGASRAGFRHSGFRS